MPEPSRSWPLFPLGQVMSTPGALAALRQHHCLPHSLLLRHLSGDWGQVALEEAARNDQALVNDERLLSSYEIAAGVVVWVITEWDRSVTTLLLPVEY